MNDPPRLRGKPSANPPHNAIDHEKAERERIRLYYYHKRAGTLETYYLQFDGDRPRGSSRSGNER